MEIISSKVFLILVTLIFKSGFGYETFTFDYIQPSSNATTQQNAVKQLIQRLIPDKSKYFDVQINPKLSSGIRDVFNIIKTEDSQNVKIIGSNGVAAAWGFQHYLKYFCNCHVSWDADQLNLPEILPNINITITANDRFRYYQNVCTTSYSYVWWSLERWIREIDWMAMNGINLALAFNGQEEIWRRVYGLLGLTEDEINEFFTGPAFLSWGRMGNIRGWGGPLSTTWHKQSVDLQIKILELMRNIGITPIVPAFAGQVPRAFKRLFPDAHLQPFETWNGFPDEYCCPYLLSPEDPLFQRVGKLFLKEYISQFGTDHLYSCDTFNEMLPPSQDLDFLRSVGRRTYQAMSDVDSKAVWVLQGWFLKNEYYFWTEERAEAYLTSVSLGKIIVLDLQGELNPQYNRFDSFFGQPFIWCMLHNFGGTLGMQGTATQVNQGPFVARNFTNSTMVGTGLTPEGINQNYVMYDLMNEMSWRKSPVDLNSWFEDYSVRRYGKNNTHAKKLWLLLKGSVYNYIGDEAQHGKYVFVHSPNLHIQVNLWYNKYDVIQAWDEGVKILDTWPSDESFPETFLYDIVDLSRQSLQLLLDDSYLNIIDHYHEEELKKCLKECEVFSELLNSMEQLLSSHKAFLLNPWIESAKSFATTQEESKLFEMNARNQITLWGPSGQIKDYANKQWAGLIHHYYYPRWKVFFNYIESVLTNKTHFNQEVIEMKMFNEVEYPFSFYYEPINETYTGNVSDVVKKVYSKWRPTFNLNSSEPTIQML